MSTPILNSLIASGAIRVVDRDLIGTAADGVEVLIGSIGHESLAERYLSDFPTPAHW